MDQKLKDRIFYARELRSNECQCGKAKKPKHSFCYECYVSLPYEYKKNIYKQIGQGYEEAYEIAVDYLNQD